MAVKGKLSSYGSLHYILGMKKNGKWAEHKKKFFKKTDDIIDLCLQLFFFLCKLLQLELKFSSC